MLVEFTVSNFKSIKEPQTLSMVATNAKEHPDNVFQPSPNEDIKLLKTAVIYGANASGKSNLLEAISALYQLVANSTKYSIDESIEAFKPFKLLEDNLLPVSFEIEFFDHNGIRYNYSVKFHEDEIIHESLFFYPKNQKAMLFIRDKGVEIKFGDSLKGNKKTIEELLVQNQLFLSKAAINNNKQLGQVYSALICITHVSTELKGLTKFTNENVLETNHLPLLASLLRKADTGIDDVEVGAGQFFNTSEPKFIHKIYNSQNQISRNANFDLSEESDGTKKLYGLGGFILDTLLYKYPSAIFIDELNNSFHPLISEMLVKLYNSPEANLNNCQLIMTTHDTSLLSPELFRRDQIWFTEKDQYGATSLYSLAEFDFSKVRANVPFGKWYLDGMFGALPLIKDFKLSMDAEPQENK